MAEARIIIWAPEAEKDLENILNYLEIKWTNKVILDFIDNLFITLEWIASNPSLFMKISKADNIRKYVLSKNHSLYFEFSETHLYLLRIFDNKQNPSNF
jgi:plasmid stabilization system protein ParE